jgi:hypothetical protein
MRRLLCVRNLLKWRRLLRSRGGVQVASRLLLLSLLLRIDRRRSVGGKYFAVVVS